jgi:hypothetical protein
MGCWVSLGETLGKMMMLLVLGQCGPWPMAHGKIGYYPTLMAEQKSW